MGGMSMRPMYPEVESEKDVKLHDFNLLLGMGRGRTTYKVIRQVHGRYLAPSVFSILGK